MNRRQPMQLLVQHVKLSYNLSLAAIFLRFAVPLFAQDSPPADHSTMHLNGNVTALHLTAKVAIAAEANRPVYKPARCDAEGNIYFRAYQPEDRRVPVVRADAKGKTKKYSLDSDPDFAKATAYDFSVLPNGDLYQPVQLGKDVYIVAFSKQGTIRWKTRLEKQFWVSRLAAFDDKSFLVIGTEAQSGGKETRTYQSVVALFDHDGRLVRNIALGGDAVREAKLDQEEDGPKTAPPMLPLLGSDSQVGSDGKVYLLVPSDPPVVYMVDASGKTVQSLEINPPGSRMAAVSMSLDKDRLAILFRHSFQGMSHGEDVISVLDLPRRVAIGQFSAAAELGGVLACFRSNDFVFVGSEQNTLAILHARANSSGTSSEVGGKHTH